MASFASKAVRRPLADRLGPGKRLLLVPGGGSLTLDLRAGDGVTIIDPEGRQPLLFALFSKDPQRGGKAAVAFHAETAPPAASGEAFRAALDPEVAALLASKGLSESDAAVFAPAAGTPGSSFAFSLEAPGLAVILAPAEPAGIGEAALPGDLEVVLSRASSNDPAALPEPLADPLDAFVVERRSARAYSLRAGQYFQVLDIHGQQCSDLQVFPQAVLDAGREAFIDTTVSRSLSGALYPRPGLFDKYFDQELRPLVQVVQDTCGRHDTFGLACAQRIYEAKGFLGHDNCSDNISDAVAPYGVARRAAWPAINLFFNTQVGPSNVILADEGWSQAGDYVLMQAQTDLVCVSTACPDDTSPINGWNPTDILVRIYDGKTLFKKQTGYRGAPAAPSATTRESGFHARTSNLTRHYRVAKDLWIPTVYAQGGAVQEYWAAREAATIQDLSQISKFDVTGPDAEALLDHALTRDIRRLAVGQVAYSPICRPHGGMFDDGTLFRLSPYVFRWMCGDPQSGAWLRDLAEERGLNVHVRTASRQIDNLALQGPNARAILERVIWTVEQQPRLEELRRFRFLIGRLHDRAGAPLLVSRSGFTGLPGYEVFCAPADAARLWDALWDAGEDLGLAPMGLDALDMLRIEAGFPVAGQEFDDDVSPLEAGVAPFLAGVDKLRDFVGRDAILRDRQRARRRLVGLSLETAELPRGGDPVFAGEQTRAGVVTSASLSPRFGHAIALARVATPYGEVGRMLEVGCLDGAIKRLRAKVVSLPFA